MTARLSLEEYREHFAASEGYLDYARFGPPSRDVLSNAAASLALVAQARRDVDSLREHERRVLSLVAAMTGRVGAEAVVLSGSTSAGLFEVAFAMNGGPEAQVLVSPREFPANVYPWVRAMQRGGPTVAWLATSDGRVTPDAVAAALTPSTVALSVSAVDFRTGYRADLAALRDVLGDRLLVVDGIQAFGACDVEWSLADALVVGGQKWLRASWGTGFISLSSRGLERLGHGLTGWTGVEDLTRYDGMIHDALSSAGRLAMTNPDLVAASYLAGALELLEGVSIGVIERAIQQRVRGLLDVIAAHGGQSIVALAPAERSGIVSFAVPYASAEHVGARLAHYDLTATVRGDHVRLSPHATTPATAVDALDAALRSLTRD